MQICAVVLLYFLAISEIFGSLRRLGSSGLTHGRSGDPKGLKAETIKQYEKECDEKISTEKQQKRFTMKYQIDLPRTPCLLQCSMRGVWVKYG